MDTTDTTDADGVAEALMEVMRWLRPAYREVSLAVERELSRRDVSVPLRGLLEALHRIQPATTPELTRELRVPRQFVRKIVEEGRARGFVEDRPNPAHRTSHRHTLTDLGEHTFADIRRREVAVLQALHLAIEPDDARRCAELLRTLTDQFARRNATPTVRP